MTQRVVSFHYTLTDGTGKVLDSSKDRAALSFMEGAGQIIPGLERQLAVLKKGDKKKIQVPAAEAYGRRDDNKVVKVPSHELPSKDVKIGDRGNHSLAGVDLTFDVELTDVREATAEEIFHGHAHGEGGHSH